METLAEHANDNLIYPLSRVHARKHICYCALVSPSNAMSTVALRSKADIEISLAELPDEQKKEISEHLCSYTDEVLICEYEGNALAIIPSLYPSSSLCPVLLFDQNALSLSELLRLVESEDCPHIFRVSRSVSALPARMTSALQKKSKEVLELFDEIERVFTKINRISALSDENEIKKELCRYACELSYFVGCPIERIDELWEDEACSLTDAALYAAFVLCFLMVAREHSPSRSVRLELRAMSRAAEVSVVFESLADIDLSLAVLEWERLAFDRNMLFSCQRDGEEYRISFHPLRRDWSYLGLKQDPFVL